MAGLLAKHSGELINKKYIIKQVNLLVVYTFYSLLKHVYLK